MNPRRHIIPPLFLLLASLLVNTSFAQQEETTPEPAQSQQNDSSTPNSNEAADEPSATQTPRPLLDKQHLVTQKMEHLAQEVDPELLLWLGEGDKRFLSIYHQAWQPLADGAAIILHNDGQHPRWPQTSKTLSDNLAKHGWTTLAISLPASLPAKIPKRTISTEQPQTKMPANSEQAQETPSQAEENPPENSQIPTETETTDNPLPLQDNLGAQDTSLAGSPIFDPESQAFDRLMLAYDYLRQQGLLNIAIICEGTSVVRATKMISAIPTPPPSNPQARVAKPITALVSIAADHNIPQNEPFNLAKSLAELDLYIMDIYFDDSIESQRQADQRKAEALRAGLEVYRQQRLPISSGKLSQGENPLSKRVRGFLNRYAKGRAKKLP